MSEGPELPDPPPWSGPQAADTGVATTTPWSAPAGPVWEAAASGGPRTSNRGPLMVILGGVVLAVFVAAVVLAATGAISGGSSSSKASPGVTLPPVTLPGNGSGSLSPDQAVLRQLGLRATDLPQGAVFGLGPGGDQVMGQPTLDICNGTFPSEARRVARRQVYAAAADGSGELSTEAVFYDDVGGTAQAFTELRSVAAKCPPTPVQSPVGEETVITHFNAAPDHSWPQTATVERLAFDLTTTHPLGTTDHSIAVYLRRGRILIGIYFTETGTQPMTVDGKTAIPDIVGVFASRLAKLPASVVGGHEAPAAVPGAI